MNIELSEDKLNSLIEEEIKRYVKSRVERTMDNGKAYWFSQQNIENITIDVIMRKVTSEAIKQIIHSLMTDEFTHQLSDCIANELKEYLNNI